MQDIEEGHSYGKKKPRLLAHNSPINLGDYNSSEEVGGI